mmetsp:Transcript_10142/g.9154  ORF Transcript_10142/g.9154 Transcript_10142/m.9154 type:complete len:553 (-) Transcript_10142:291-1949(-)
MGCCVGTDEETKQEIEEEKKTQEIEKIDVVGSYKFGRTLGSGASCRVVQATNKDDAQIQVAIKIMDKERSITKKLYHREVNILEKLTPDIQKPHKGILPFMGHGEDTDSYYIVTKLLYGGELFDRIVSKEEEYKITEKIAVKLICDMLEAIKYCHDNNIVHRDLKPENFVFESNDQDANIILIDFGCAKIVNDDKEYKDLVGTVYYLAPELAAQSSRVHKTGKVLKMADIWSIGVIAYVMLTGRPPFKGRTNKDIFTHIIKDQLKFPSDVQLSDGFKDFVKRSLVKNPYKRISIDEALRHPWVQGKGAAEIQLNKDVIRYLRQFNYQSKLKKAITRCLAKNMSSEPEKEVKRHFTRLDKDGNGYLDAGELKLLLIDMGFAPSKAIKEAQEMLEAADQDGDGQVDFEEFKQVWHRKLLSQHDQYIHRVFAVFDDNGDGHIDSKELGQILFPERYDEDGNEKEDANNPTDENNEQQGLQDNDYNGDENGDDAIDEGFVQTIERMIKEVDLDGDGKIDFQEFKKAMNEDLEAGKWGLDNDDDGQYGGLIGPKIVE